MRSRLFRRSRRRGKWTLLPVLMVVLSVVLVPEAHAHGNGKPTPAELEHAKKRAEYGAANALAVAQEMLGAPDAMGLGVPEVDTLSAAMTQTTGISWYPRHNISPNAQVLYPNGVVSVIDFDVMISGNLNTAPSDGVGKQPFFKGVGRLIEETDPGLPPWEYSRPTGNREGTVSYHEIYFVKDVPAASAALEALGLPRWTTAYTGPGQTAPFYYALHRGPGAMNGVRIEVLDLAMSCAFIDNVATPCKQ